MSDKQPVRVTILGQTYTLRASSDPEKVEAVARKVDELMENIAARNPGADPSRVAVLACLSLADKLYDIDRNLSTLSGKLEQALEP